MTTAYDDKLAAFQQRIGYEFSDDELLLRALTHSSYGDGRRKYRNFERLEFLGDRVLGLMTAELLFLEVDDQEGGLARRLNALVRKDTCAKIAQSVDMGDILRLSKSLKTHDGKVKTSILGDACEALLAAIYLDGGIEAAKIFYMRFWKDLIEAALEDANKDPKTDLQETAVRTGYAPPKYEVLERSGPDHRPIFVIQVSITGIGTAVAEGTSKKIAERLAAKDLLKSLKEHHDRK